MALLNQGWATPRLHRYWAQSPFSKSHSRPQQLAFRNRQWRLFRSSWLVAALSFSEEPTSLQRHELQLPMARMMCMDPQTTAAVLERKLKVKLAAYGSPWLLQWAQLTAPVPTAQGRGPSLIRTDRRDSSFAVSVSESGSRGPGPFPPCFESRREPGARRDRGNGRPAFLAGSCAPAAPPHRLSRRLRHCHPGPGSGWC